jgi:hypothetical protein
MQIGSLQDISQSGPLVTARKILAASDWQLSSDQHEIKFRHSHNSSSFGCSIRAIILLDTWSMFISRWSSCSFSTPYLASPQSRRHGIGVPANSILKSTVVSSEAVVVYSIYGHYVRNRLNFVAFLVNK